jgi:hypothetical protein
LEIEQMSSFFGGLRGSDLVVDLQLPICNQCLSECCVFESCSGEGYSMQHYVIKFVSDLQQVTDKLYHIMLHISNNNNHYSCTEICTIYYNLITK